MTLLLTDRVILRTPMGPPGLDLLTVRFANNGSPFEATFPHWTPRFHRLGR